MIRSLAAILAAALLVAVATPSVRAAEPYEINVIMPLTGSAAFLGKAENQSLQLIEGVVNKTGGIKGRPVKFVVQDDQSSPQVAVQLANAVIAKKVPVILGSSVVAMCNAIAALVKNGPVQYCFSPGIHPPQGSYTFSASVSTKDLIAVYLTYFRSMGWTKVALLFSTDGSGQDAERSFDEELKLPENKAVQIVAREHFNTTDVSVAAQISHIKAADPQVVVAWTTGTPFATVLRAYNESGMTAPLATTNGNMTYAQMAQYAPYLPKTLLFPGLSFFGFENVAKGPVRDAQKVFYDAFAAINVKPDAANSFDWDPIMIVIDALRAKGTDATAAQVRDYIANLHDYAGIDGIYDFRDAVQRGLTRSNALVTRWDAAKGTWVAISKPGGAPLR
ncbi:MAG: ABC transporter substrate-binding protein [Vulcanimicrobiaceae bacterium]